MGAKRSDLFKPLKREIILRQGKDRTTLRERVGNDIADCLAFSCAGRSYQNEVFSRCGACDGLELR